MNPKKGAPFMLVKFARKRAAPWNSRSGTPHPELNPNLRNFGPVELSCIFKDIIDHRLANNERQKLA
jgi:hypothetical protein